MHIQWKEYNQSFNWNSKTKNWNGFEQKEPKENWLTQITQYCILVCIAYECIGSAFWNPIDISSDFCIQV